MRFSRGEIALFDHDNTLLVGDIGEAVFAQLIRSGAVHNLTWKGYQSDPHLNAARAYRRVVSAMEGLSVREVEEATMMVLENSDPFIRLEEIAVPVPRPHHVMRELMELLKQLGYDIYVISGSNQISVRVAVALHFGLPAQQAFGIENRAVNGIAGADLVDPVPIHAGKVEMYRKFVGAIAPLLTATDSIIDEPMLEMTDTMGLSLWAGKNRAEYETAAQQMWRQQRFCFVRLPGNYSFKNNVRTPREHRSIVVESALVSAEA